MKNRSQSNQHQSTILIMSILGVVLFGLVIVWVSVFGLSQYKNVKTQSGQPVAQYVAEDEKRTLLTLIPEETTFVKNKKTSARIEIDTQGGQIDTLGAVLRYDKTKLRIDEMSFDGSVFSKIVLNNNNQDQGFAQLTLAMSDQFQTFAGKGHLVRIYFTPLVTTDVEITFDCSHTSAYLLSVNKISSCSNLKGLTVGNISETQGTGGGSTSTTTAQSEPHKEGPWCTQEYPQRPTNLVAVTGSKSGTVKLTWTKTPNTTHYTVTFGEKWLNFTYGSPNIGDTDQYLVTGLKPGVLYYFVITSVNGCASSGYSDGANAYAGKAVYIPKAATYVKTTPLPTHTPVTSSVNYPTTRPTTYPTAVATPLLEVPPQATTSSGLYDDWNNTGLILPSSTPEPTLVPETEAKGSLLLTLAKILPWVGLFVLVVLGIMLVKFIKGGNGHEKPPVARNFSAEDELTNEIRSDVIQPPNSPSNPLAPPFGQ